MHEVSGQDLEEKEPLELTAGSLEESQEVPMEEVIGLDLNEKAELYAHTFVVLKGENLLCQLMEPEARSLVHHVQHVYTSKLTEDAQYSYSPYI